MVAPDSTQKFSETRPLTNLNEAPQEGQGYLVRSNKHTSAEDTKPGSPWGIREDHPNLKRESIHPTPHEFAYSTSSGIMISCS